MVWCVTIILLVAHIPGILSFIPNTSELLDFNSPLTNFYRKNTAKKKSIYFGRGYHSTNERIASKSTANNQQGSKNLHEFEVHSGSYASNARDEELDGNLMRNFCIIAHVDHGKSTLADRFLEYTKSVPSDAIQEQYLDNMELERERGITIKLQTAMIKYNSTLDGKTYKLNLIDTPGHIDFNHEARRSISACEGAILVVDGTKGIQAQTVTTAKIAIDSNLKIIPVINKIDIPHCDIANTTADLKQIFGFKDEEILKVSAKTGLGIEEILETIVLRVPPPLINLDKPFRALVFDSHYDIHKGVVCYIRVVDGKLKRLDEITLLGTDIGGKASSLGILLPEMKETESLQSGQVGWVSANIKESSKIQVGATISLKSALKKGLVEPVNRFEDSKPTVFAGIYPTGSTDYLQLRAALDKLKLNDHSFIYEPSESSIAGQGFKCGFNGLLHLDIIVQRLEREYNAEVVITSPSVPYRCTLTDGSVAIVNDAVHWPQDSQIQFSEEPWTNVTVRIPADTIGKIMALLSRLRGEFVEKNEMDGTNTIVLKYRVPLSEIISEFFDKLKSLTNGYGSFDYRDIFYKQIELCKLRILVNGEEAHGLATITPRASAYNTGKLLVDTLCKIIPRKLFKIPIQAAIGKRVIATGSIPAVKKNVIERCSGGDPSRKRKLLENQARGKKVMAQVGNVSIPADAYKEIIKALRP